MLHDPLTTATLVEPGLCTFVPEEIRVDEGAATTVGAGTLVEVASDVDVAATRAHLMRAWTGSAR